MKIPKYGYTALIAAIIAMATLAGCSNDDSVQPSAPEDDGIAILSLKINLLQSQPGLSSHATRVGEEYESDKWAANDGEKMHTVRVIILNSDGFVEHNSLWDLTSAPDVTATGREFPVTANDTKKIILVANEAYATLTLPDGTKIPAADYFNSFSAAAGSFADLVTLAKITFNTADNKALSGYDGCIASPLSMSAVHEYHIGDPGENYSATFTIHRAAVKYTYRFTNTDTMSHTIDAVMVNNVASDQYFFPNADYTDDGQYFLSAYRTPADAGARILRLETALTVKAGETVELSPLYFPEGIVADADNPYSTAFYFDGIFSGWSALKWSMPQTPENLNLMTDLPRNTHVIVNVKFAFAHFAIDYTVCPWNETEVDLPSFN